MTLPNSSDSRDGIAQDNVFKILLATDIHLGYNETDLTTGEDSFNTFEEILMLAVSRDVDFVLLGGDLFHKAQPSSNTLNRCIHLMQTYSLGSKNIKFKILPPADEDQSSESQMSSNVNYKDPNINVSYPIFSIHGNHDDTVNNLSALDLLSSTKLVNYFGKWQSLTDVQLTPICLEKNQTKIALYGLSHIPDRRLYNLFKEDKVEVKAPNNVGDYFRILVLHQNRADRGARNTITMDLLPNCWNLIIWGHEHDCRIEPEPYGDVHVTQPGSSVATSLCEGEAIEKKVGILRVCYDSVKKQQVFKLQPIPLKTVRPFIFKSIELKNFEEELRQFKGRPRDRVEKFLEGEIEAMIKESEKLLTKHPKQPTLPLIRLRVLFEETEHLLNIKRFGYNYVKRVANTGDMLLFKRVAKRLKVAKVDIDDKELSKAVAKREQLDHVEDVVEKYFNSLTEEKDKLKLMNIKCLSEICRCIVDKEDEEGARKLLHHQIQEATNYSNIHLKVIEQAPEIIQQFRDDRSLAAYEESFSNLMAFKRQPLRQSSNAGGNSDHEELENRSDEENEQANVKPTRGRGRGSRGSRGTTRGSKAAANTTKSTRGKGKNQTAGFSIVQQLSMRQTQQSMFIDDSD